MATRYRCTACGNLTRFDVVRDVKLKEFLHFDLAGNPQIATSEVLSEEIQSVTCRWCGTTTKIEEVEALAVSDNSEGE